MTRFFFAAFLLTTTAAAQPRPNFKLAEARAFNNYGESRDIRERGTPCLTDKRTGRLVCKTLPQWRKLAARLAAEERTGGR